MSESSLIYPYEYSQDALEITFEGISLDGGSGAADEFVDVDHNSITLCGLDREWSEVSLNISVSDTNDQLKSVVPDSGSLGSVCIYLVIRNKYTRERTGIRLKESDDGKWSGDLSLSRDNLFRATDLKCYAVLYKSINELPGFAHRNGECIASSVPWKIYTDMMPPMPGGALNSEWRNFAEDEIQELRTRADTVWYLDLRDQESPRLLLNQGVLGLRSALEVTKKTGKAARVRDTLIHSIIQSVLMELAVFILAESEGSQPEDLPEWQQKMLKTLARTEPGATEDLKVEEWLVVWNNGGVDQWLVLRDMSTAIQRYLAVSRSSEQLIKAMEKEISND